MNNTTAIEFLQKAKAICSNRICSKECPLYGLNQGLFENMGDESELVNNVMEYKIEEVNDESNNTL